MADNISIPDLSITAASDEIGGFHYQRVKLTLGADGTAVDALAGAGAVGTGVQRTTLASDDPAVTSLSTLAGVVTSSRAAVNPISGQTGVAGGAGAVGATVQRATLASDDPAVVALQIIDDWDESDRAKVNPIAGQAGVAGGSGGVSATTQRMVLATDVALPAGTNMLGNVTPEGTEYEVVLASQTAQVIGATGATGDYIAGILVTPATTSPGVVTLLDNATSIPLFVGGASSIATLHPFMIPLGIKSVSGAWKITTGANVSCVAMGNFT
jgi:hypothetical protein